MKDFEHYLEVIQETKKNKGYNFSSEDFTKLYGVFRKETREKLKKLGAPQILLTEKFPEKIESKDLSAYTSFIAKYKVSDDPDIIVGLYNILKNHYNSTNDQTIKNIFKILKEKIRQEYYKLTGKEFNLQDYIFMRNQQLKRYDQDNEGLGDFIKAEDYK